MAVFLIQTDNVKNTFHGVAETIVVVRNNRGEAVRDRTTVYINVVNDEGLDSNVDVGLHRHIVDDEENIDVRGRSTEVDRLLQDVIVLYSIISVIKIVQDIDGIDTNRRILAVGIIYALEAGKEANGLRQTIGGQTYVASVDLRQKNTET